MHPRESSAAAILCVLLGVFAPSPAVACDSDVDCPAETPYCDADVCIECFLDLDCPLTEPRCDALSGSCEGCAGDVNCSGYPETPACTASGACEECSATNASACAGTTPVCDADANTCIACTSNADCATSPDGPVCSSNGSCDVEETTCPAAPLDVCSLPGRSLVRMAVSERIARNSIQWRWIGGSAALEDFGDPMTTTDYSVCIYRGGESFFSGQIDSHPSRWKWTGKGFRYRHRDDPAGLQRLTLLAGGGKAKIVIRAKGIYLTPPALPMNGAPVVVQIVRRPRADGVCWGAGFAAPYVADTPSSFGAKGAY